MFILVFLTSLLMFASGLSAFVSNRSHILTSLIALELMALALFSALNLGAALSPSESYLALLYLALAVCEGALGLGILVAFSTAKGSDSILLASSLQW
uniref:NADH-ubiquinone oxidoreductase chain 4L n=1 Tax=Eurydice pulchra TaxID=155694 RepID=E3SX81_EURPU|nr:NADH dehydrogenase subunit 4L [Eurydice pulchra]